MTTFYIAGPISDPDPAKVERNKQAFVDAAQTLRDRGLTVVSPVELCPEVGVPWEWYMRRCVKALMDCDEVVLLTGWMRSMGARLEVDIAHGLGMRYRVLKVVLAQEAAR